MERITRLTLRGTAPRCKILPPGPSVCLIHLIRMIRIFRMNPPLQLQFSVRYQIPQPGPVPQHELLFRRDR